MQLILASGSPRRKELLAHTGLSFRVVPSRYEERAEGLSAQETVALFAEGKAREVFGRYPHALVLGADTVVCFRGEIFGKPKDEADAARMLRALGGNTHEVYTGVCLLGEGFEKHGIVRTEVTFHPLSEELIARYIAGGSPMDKAGAYGVQDGVPLVKEIAGSYTNVMGLPMELVSAYLKEVDLC